MPFEYYAISDGSVTQFVLYYIGVGLGTAIILSVFVAPLGVARRFLTLVASAGDSEPGAEAADLDTED